MWGHVYFCRPECTNISDAWMQKQRGAHISEEEKGKENDYHDRNDRDGDDVVSGDSNSVVIVMALFGIFGQKCLSYAYI